mgnify:FL=1
MPCEPSAMGSMVEVLKLILQPVVENSILYGMERLEHVLRIRVAAYHRGNSLVLTVTDNGIGMDEAALGLAACGGSSSSSTAASAPASSAAASAASGSGKPYEGVVLH